MSGRSVNNSSVVVSAGAGSSVPQHACSGLPNGVKFAGEESKDKLYEPKHMKKIVRVLTVVAYVFTVSLAAIMLSVYYVFLWNPKDVPHRTARLATPTPVSPPDAACRQSAAASLQEQQKIPGVPLKAEDRPTASLTTATAPASLTRQLPTNSTPGHPLDT